MAQSLMENNVIMSIIILIEFIIIIIIQILIVQTSAHVVVQEQKKEFSRLIIFSFDGFRPDYIDELNTPNLYCLRKEGVEGDMIATFITKTFPNHHTIATGLYEPDHGIVNNYFDDPENLEIGPFSLQNLTSTFFWDMFNRTVPIYIANELYEKGRYSAVFQWPGSLTAYTDGEDLSKRYLSRYRTSYQHYEDLTPILDILFEWVTLSEDSPNLILIYIDEPDTTGHSNDIRGPIMEEKLNQIDTFVGNFMKKLREHGLDNKWNTIFLSDHGMAEVDPNRVIYLEDCKLIYDGLQYEMIGKSPIYSINPLSKPEFWKDGTETLESSVQNILNLCAKELYNNSFHVYKPREIPEEFHYSHNRRIGPLVIIADAGYDLFDVRDPNWPPKHPYGNHGWDNMFTSMKPLFLATGPSFKSHYKHPIQFQNIDLFPLFLRLLEIPLDKFPNHNGTFSKVKDMLRS